MGSCAQEAGFKEVDLLNKHHDGTIAVRQLTQNWSVLGEERKGELALEVSQLPQKFDIDGVYRNVVPQSLYHGPKRTTMPIICQLKSYQI